MSGLWVGLCEILTSDIMNNIFLWLLTRSLLKETGSLESQLEANKVSSVCSLPENIARIKGVQDKPLKDNPTGTFG